MDQIRMAVGTFDDEFETVTDFEPDRSVEKHFTIIDTSYRNAQDPGVHLDHDTPVAWIGWGRSGSLIQLEGYL